MQEKKYNTSKFSENLRNIRNSRNKTQSEVAFGINIDVRNYQRLESKKTPDIKMSTLINILNYFDISLDELLK